MRGIWGDIRFGLRSLGANRRFTAVTLLTIVLTVGGITTVFTLVNSVLLRPLPYPDPGRLVLLRQKRWTGAYGHSVTAEQYLDFGRDVPSFESTELLQLSADFLDAEKDPLQLQAIPVTPGLFPMLGVKTVLGRPLLADDAKLGSPAVAVIGFDLWQSRFGSSRDIIGKPLRLVRQRTYTIVGVMAARFRHSHKSPERTRLLHCHAGTSNIGSANLLWSHCKTASWRNYGNGQRGSCRLFPTGSRKSLPMPLGDSH